MIVVDIETSGLYPEKNGVWQIGALDFSNPENTFLEESRIDDEDEIAPEALKIIGKTEAELRDKNKQSQKEMIEKFFEWTKSVKIKNLMCHTFLDHNFLSIKARKYYIKIPFAFRAFDLHSMAQALYYRDKEEFLLEENEIGTISGMSLPKIMELCGLEDDRIQLRGSEVIKEGKPHNALEDAKTEAECLSRMLNGKNLFPEYEKFPVPENLKK